MEKVDSRQRRMSTVSREKVILKKSKRNARDEGRLSSSFDKASITLIPKTKTLQERKPTNQSLS